MVLCLNGEGVLCLKGEGVLCLKGEGVLCLKSDGVPVEPSRPPGGVESSPSPLSCPPSWKPSSLETLLLLLLPCTGMWEPLTSRGPCS